MSLTEDLRRVLSAASSEPGRNERELQRQSYEDRDELAPRRNEVDRYPTRAALDEDRGEDEMERDLRGF